MDDSAHPTPDAHPSGEAPRPEGSPAEVPGPAPTRPSPEYPPPPQPPQFPPPPGLVTAFPPPEPPKPFRRGFGLGAGAGLGVGAALLVVSVVISLVTGALMISFVAAAGALAGSGQIAAQGVTAIWGSETASKTIRAIPVRGTILTQASDGLVLTGGTYGYEVADVLDDLSDTDADAIVLLLDTPGGSITGSRAMADAIDRYRERTGHKVFAFVEGMSASGGMYTMAGADEIVADYGSLVGSIGVIMGPIDYYRNVTSIDGGLLGTGVTAEEVTSEYITAGRGKDAGNPFRQLTAEERASFQALIDYEYGTFVSIVSAGRGIPAERIVNELGAGIFATGPAKEIGLIDDVMGRDPAFRHFAEAAGLDPADTRVVTSQAPNVWAQLLGAEARPWGVALAATPEGGQPARASASLCTDHTEVLAWYGSRAGACG